MDLFYYFYFVIVFKEVGGGGGGERREGRRWWGGSGVALGDRVVGVRGIRVTVFVRLSGASGCIFRSFLSPLHSFVASRFFVV